MSGKISYRTAAVVLTCSAVLMLSGCLKAPGNAALKAVNEDPTVVEPKSQAAPTTTGRISGGLTATSIQLPPQLPSGSEPEPTSLFGYANTIVTPEEKARRAACEKRFPSDPEGCKFEATPAQCKRSGWPSPCHLSFDYIRKLECTSLFGVSIDSCVEGTSSQCKASNQGHTCYVTRGYNASATTIFGKTFGVGD